MTALYAAVVLYNHECELSATCRALSALPAGTMRVLLWDNSTRDVGAAAFCRAHGWTYLGGTGNLGLSRAYNACLDHLRAQGAEGLLCLFDDDSEVDEAYFSAVLAAHRANPDRILAPVVRSGGTLLSPCRMKPGMRTERFSSEDALKAAPEEGLSAINSGLAIPLSLLRDYRYDEHIFLDGVDHRFLQDMRARGHGLALMDYTFDHAFSGDERPPMPSALRRFEIYARDYAYILRDRPRDFWALALRRALRLTLQYRSPAFLRVLSRVKRSGKT